MAMIDFGVLTDGLAQARGLCWYAGDLWFSDAPDRKVIRINAATGERLSSYMTPFRPCGLVVLEAPEDPTVGPGDDVILATQAEPRTIVRITRQGEVDEFAVLGSAAAGTHVAEMIPAPFGGAYVCGTWSTETGGTLLHVSLTGAVTEVASGLDTPTGLAVTERGSTLLVACAADGAPSLVAFDVQPDSTLAGRRTIAELAADLRPEAIAVTSEGEIVVAVPEGKCLVLVGPDGQTVRRYDLPAKPHTCAVEPGGRTVFAGIGGTSVGKAGPRDRESSIVTFRLD